MIGAEVLKGKKPCELQLLGFMGKKEGCSRSRTPRCCTARGQGLFFFFLTVGSGLGAGLYLGVGEPQG